MQMPTCKSREVNALGTVPEAGHRPAFVSTELANKGEKKVARAVVAGSLLLFVCVVPFAGTPIAPIPPFTPGYEAALGVTNTVTAVLLLGQFMRLRSHALLMLGSGYLLNALMAVIHGFSLPRASSATSLLGTGPQTTAWLYAFWHIGFPLFVLAYAILVRYNNDRITGSPGRAIGWAIAGVALSATVLTSAATAGLDHLPALIRDGDHALQVSNSSSPVLCVLSAGVLLILWWRSVPTALELWLMVVMAAWFLDVTCSTVLSAHRSDLGYYAGRLYGLLASTLLLGALLFEMNRLYGKVADALALAEMRNEELARSREEFARVQRFEAIGHLVGGVAHDFNNLLTVITGALDLTLRDQNLPLRARRMLDMSMAAARRGSELTGQLLTFARKQVLQPEVLNLNEVIANLETFLARATGERIRVVMELSPVLWPARVDRAQFETALVNLVLNARDALNGEGPIVIRTRNIVVDAAAILEVPAGDCVVVSVSDSGAGMASEVVARAVDPFFTTKDVGKGSGLGLSQVYGFARAASGGLRIASELGSGTTVEI
jgi:signal transduction histidine kinase